MERVDRENDEVTTPTEPPDGLWRTPMSQKAEPHGRTEADRDQPHGDPLCTLSCTS